MATAPVEAIADAEAFGAYLEKSETVLECLRAQSPRPSTLHKIRAYLRRVYALQSSVKSVPLRALLTAYPQLFVIDGTSVAERSRGATPVPSF